MIVLESFAGVPGFMAAMFRRISGARFMGIADVALRYVAVR